MNQVIVFKNAQSGVSVCYPTGELPIEEVLAKDCPEGAIIVENASLPNEHNEFFDAWELNGTTVTVNLDKAKEIKKQHLRAERAPLLQKLDVDYQRADEASDAAKKAEVVAEKQRLRDITQLADQATTLDELKAITVGA